MTPKSISRITRRGMIVSRWADPLGGHRQVTSKWIYGVLAAVTCLAAGCGSDIPFDSVPVQGTITYDDGTPIPGVYLQFAPETSPLDSKTYPRPGVAEVAGDGTIELVTTYNYADGIVTGKHKVIVKSQNAAGLRTRAVAAKYGSAKTTPLVVDTAEVPFQIKIEKPKSRKSKSRR
jgi:hypothetical protein